jgi:hypothetical protein
MPALKEKSISLLGSVLFGFGASGAAGTATAFTCPPGKLARVTHVTVLRPTASLVAITGVNFGSFFNNSANYSLATMTATTNHLTLASTAQGNSASAGQAFAVMCASGAGAVSATFNAWGFLDNT